MNEQSPQAGKKFSFDIASALAIAGIVLLAPIVFIPGSTVSLLGTKVAIIAILVCLSLIGFVVARLLRGSIVIPPLTLIGALWLVPLAYVLSTLFSGVNPVYALAGDELESDTLGFMLLLALIGTLTALTLRRAKDFKNVLVAFGVSLGILLVAQFLFIIVSRVSPGLVSPADNLIGAFGDIGMLAGLGIVLTLIAFRFFSFGKVLRPLLIVGMVLAFVLIALVNSPVIYAVVGLGSLGLFIEGMLRRRTQVKDPELEDVSTLAEEAGTDVAPAQSGSVALPLVTLIVSVFLIIGGSIVGNALSSVTGVSVLDVRPSWNATFDIGSHTYASSPLFGSGPGTFGEQWLRFRDRNLNDTLFWNIDFGAGIGSIPTSFVTTGALGVLAWLAFLALFFLIGIRTFLFRLPEDGFMRFASIASFTLAAAILVFAFFATPGPVILALGFVFIGMFISSLRYGKDRPEWAIIFSRTPRLGFMIVFGLTLLLLASIAGAYAVIERYAAAGSYGSAFQALSRNDIDAAERDISRSVTLVPTDRAYRLGAAAGIERMRMIAADTTLDPNVAQQQFQAALSNSIAAGLEAARLQPNDYQNWTVLGNVYQSVASLAIEGAYEEAKISYERAAALNPTSPVIPYVIAQLELTEKNMAASEERLLAAVSLKRDYIPAILLLSQLKVQTGEAREALEAAEAAAYLAPNEPSVLLSVGLLRAGINDMPGAITALSRAVELNQSYANARFFLAALYSYTGDKENALLQLRAVSALSEANAAAVAEDVASLEAGENPFPLTRLRSLGIPQAPVAEPEPAAN